MDSKVYLHNDNKIWWWIASADGRQLTSPRVFANKAQAVAWASAWVSSWISVELIIDD